MIFLSIMAVKENYRCAKEFADTLLEIMQKEDHKVVLAVSHGGACRGFMRYWQETSQVDQKAA